MGLLRLRAEHEAQVVVAFFVVCDRLPALVILFRGEQERREALPVRVLRPFIATAPLFMQT